VFGISEEKIQRKDTYVPAVIAMYPGVVDALEFSFTTQFAPSHQDNITTPRPSFPSFTHLLVMLELQRLIGNILCCVENHLSISEGHKESLLLCLRDSFLFARELNDDFSVREVLHRSGWKYGTSSSDELPNMLHQEMNGKQMYLKVLFNYIHIGTDPIKKDNARNDMSEYVFILSLF